MRRVARRGKPGGTLDRKTLLSEARANGGGTKSKTANIIAACGVLVTGIGALPGLVGMARGEGAAQPYRNLLGSAGEAPATEPTETVDLTARELEPAAPSAPVAVAAPPAPIGPDGVPM